MRKQLRLSKTNSKLEDVNRDREYLVACLIQINIEKSKDNMESSYTDYWKEQFQDLDMENLTVLIKVDFNYLEEGATDKVKNIMREKAWTKATR